MDAPAADTLATVAAGRTALVARLRTIASRVEALPLESAAEVLVLLEPAVAALEKQAGLSLKQAPTGVAEPGTSNERLEYFRWMADAAWRRFDSRRRYEWQANFALWAAIGAITAFLIGLKNVDSGDRAVVTIGVGVVFFVYTTVWSPWLHSSNARDQRAAYYWESAVQNGVHVKEPSHIRPMQPWPRFPVGQTDPPPPDAQAESRPSGYRARLKAFYCTSDGIRDNPSAGVQIMLTLLVALLPLGAVWCRSPK